MLSNVISLKAIPFERTVVILSDGAIPGYNDQIAAEKSGLEHGHQSAIFAI